MLVQLLLSSLTHHRFIKVLEQFNNFDYLFNKVSTVITLKFDVSSLYQCFRTIIIILMFY